MDNSIFIILHIVISFLLAITSSLFLKKKIRNWKKVFFFMFLFNFSVPVFGYIASVFITFHIKYVKYEEELEDVSSFDLTLFETDFINVDRQFGEGSMQEMMSHKDIPTQKKIKALVSMANNLSRENTLIIKNTLSNDDDEVRLYSFAIIDKIEKDINSKIDETIKRFIQEIDEIKKAYYAKELAELYWEMIYYQLTEEALKDFILKELKKYLYISLDILHNDNELHILMGKVLMLEKKYSQAEIRFLTAIKLAPNDAEFIMPYLAEIYFIQKDFKKVKELLNNTTELQLNAKLYPIIEQWKKAS